MSNRLYRSGSHRNSNERNGNQRICLENLEDRRHFAVTLNVTGTGGDDTITIVCGSAIGVTVNGTTTNYGDNAYSDIVIDALGGADVIKIQSNTTHPITVNGGDGIDTLELAHVSHNMSAIDSDVTFHGGDGSDVVLLNDENEPDHLPVTFTLNTYDRSGFPLFTFDSTSFVTLNMGSGTSTVDILGTATGTTLSVYGGAGDETYRVAPTARNLDAIQGTLLLYGQAGTNTLVINDQSAVGYRQYRLKPDTLVRQGSANIGFGQFAGVTFNASDAASDFFVEGSTVGLPVTLNGNLGADVFHLGGSAAHQLDPINQSITINAGGDVGDWLYLEDYGNANADSYGIYSDHVIGSAMADVFFSGISDVILQGSTAGNNITVNIGDTVKATVLPGFGQDTINVVETGMFNSYVMINSGLDGDTLNVNTDAAGHADVRLIGTLKYAAINIRSGGTLLIQPGSNTDVIVNALAIEANASFDIADNALIFDYAAGNNPTASVLAMLQSGRGATGLWNGFGINTSMSDPNFAVGLGESLDLLGAGQHIWRNVIVDDTALLLRRTIVGDANLDGDVNVLDLGRVASNWQKSTTWSGGDFNYTGTVDVNDLGALAANWQQTLNPPAASAFSNTPISGRTARRAATMVGL